LKRLIFYVIFTEGAGVIWYNGDIVSRSGKQCRQRLRLVKSRQISDDGSYVTIADCMAVQPEWMA